MEHTTNYDSKKYKLACKKMRELIKTKYKGYFVYHVKDSKGIIVGSVCVIEIDKDEYARGITIKSPLDNTCKSVGSSWAMRRAIRAADKNTVETFKGTRLAETRLIGSFMTLPEINSMIDTKLPHIFKCENEVDLTKFEIKMLESRGNIGE